MYVVRWVAKVKRGYAQNVINFNKGVRDGDHFGGKVVRIYANVFGDNDIVCTEVEFPDIQSAAKAVEFVESGETQAKVTAGSWYDISAGMVVEMWKVIE